MWRGDFDWAPANPGAQEGPSAEFQATFAASMPARYRVLFDQRAIARHAAVALRRGGRPACAEVWRALPDGSAALCIVAEDRPGLLSAIAAALVLHKLDVLTALVFSRSLPSGESEAVDLVWVRRASQKDTDAIGADESESIGEVLGAIVSGKISTEQIASQATAPPSEADPTVFVGFDPVDECRIGSDCPGYGGEAIGDGVGGTYKSYRSYNGKVRMTDLPCSNLSKLIRAAGRGADA